MLVAWLREPQVALFSELRGQATSSTEAQRVTSDKSSGGSFPGCTFDLSRSTRVEQTDPEEIMLQKVQRSILLKQWQRSALCLPAPPPFPALLDKPGALLITYNKVF